jgi:hypothetical protein
LLICFGASRSLLYLDGRLKNMETAVTIASEQFCFNNTDDFIEQKTRSALFSAWKGLSKLQRPTKPRNLIQLLLDNYTCPILGFHPAPNKRHDLENQTDANLKRFVEAARALRSGLPHSDHEYVLSSLLGTRIASDAAGAELNAWVRRLEDWLANLHPVNDLLPRQPRKRPPSVKDLYIRDLVRTVFWYILRVEQTQPTVSFSSGTPLPTSRAAVLATVTVAALGHKTEGIKTHLEAVRDDESWRCPSFDAWATRPRAAA